MRLDRKLYFSFPIFVAVKSPHGFLILTCSSVLYVSKKWEYYFTSTFSNICSTTALGDDMANYKIYELSALAILRNGKRGEDEVCVLHPEGFSAVGMVNDLADILLYVDFSRIFGRGSFRYLAFERSNSMSRQARLSFIREDFYAPVKERIQLGMEIGLCQLSKLYAYNGLMLTSGFRVEDGKRAELAHFAGTPWASILQKNPLFLREPTLTKELDALAESTLREYAMGRLAVAGDNRYLSGDLLRFVYCMVREQLGDAAAVELERESLGEGEVYAPGAVYAPNTCYTLLRNPQKPRNWRSSPGWRSTRIRPVSNRRSTSISLASWWNAVPFSSIKTLSEARMAGNGMSPR